MSRVKLSKLSDEEILEFMESVESDEKDFSSDDDFHDPNFEPEKISAENEPQFLRDMNSSDMFIAEAVKDTVTTDEEIIPLTDSIPSTSKPLISTPAQNKRVHSPLPTVESIGPAVVPTNGGFIGSIVSINKDSAEFSKVIWRQSALKLHVNEVEFHGSTLLPEYIKELSTPTQLFLYFFTKEIIELIVQETNRCALSQDVNSKFNVNVEDICHYIGVHLYMSIYRYPNLESYWSKNSFKPICNTMPLKRFEAIKRYLCFRDESERAKKGQPGYDPLFRIRNIMNLLNEHFDSIPKNARLCVDEQMCSTKMKHHLRQYMPNKPHKWGMKLFVLCDSFGYAYRFEIYNGAGDNIVLPNCPDLGSSANVVVRLSQTVNDFMYHIIYFDNFFTSLPLLVYLRARGIFGLGTIRVNRIPNCKLPLDSAVAKEERGYSKEFVGSIHGIDISTVLWRDNKAVRLASTYVGVEPFARQNSNEHFLDTK